MIFSTDYRSPINTLLRKIYKPFGIFYFGWKNLQHTVPLTLYVCINCVFFRTLPLYQYSLYTYAFYLLSTLSIFYKQRSIFSHPWSIPNFQGCCLFFNEKFEPSLLILVSTVCLHVGFKAKKSVFHLILLLKLTNNAFYSRFAANIE